MADRGRHGDQGAWYLEGSADGAPLARRYALKAFPFSIGRADEADMTIPAPHVSSLHAEISAGADGLVVRDLGSSNGTFVNGDRIARQHTLDAGDVMHFAGVQFVVDREGPADSDPSATCVLGPDQLAASIGRASSPGALRQMLRECAVTAHFQPIVRLPERTVVGFELLGRGTHADLPSAPGPLFEVAEAAGLAVELSELFRTEGARHAQALPEAPELFVNTHPAELSGGGLIDSLEALRRAYPRQALVMEVHEGTITNLDVMRRTRAVLAELDIKLAYDDFGAGQARLLELAEAPPDYLKFDISLVRDIDRAPRARRHMLETLASLVSGMGITCVAEGVERNEELEVCFELGFERVQGYHVGRPAPAESWAHPSEDERTVLRGNTASA